MNEIGGYDNVWKFEHIDVTKRINSYKDPVRTGMYTIRHSCCNKLILWRL